ncbi:MAG: hypothetical protein JWN02_1623, partial [Acidobacteria bacterium]|nr:hypothetical protein [Acidobacteriota bacterium]
GYSPAWVYWMYGPSYVGWAPAGWYDCYRPYYNWCYRPYAQAGLDFGFGFFGRVRVNDIDLRPWTFINSGVLVSTRVDRAALTTDVIRERLQRGGAAGGFATVSGSPARFTRNELRDPATVSDVIARRGAAGGGTGTIAGGTDMTPFFRRDPDLANNVRERIVGSRPSDGARASIGSGSAGLPSGNSVGGGNDGHVSRGTIDRGGIRSGVPQGGGVLDGGAAAPTVDRGGRGDSNGTIERGSPRSDGSNGNVGSWRDSNGVSHRGSNDGSSSGSTSGRDGANAPRDGSTTVPVWRDRVPRGGTTPASGDQPATAAPDRPRDDANWRNRAGRGDGGSAAVPREGGSASPRSTDSPGRGSDVPRRVIDSIGGARVTRGDGGNSGGGASSSGSSHSSGGGGGGGDRPQRSSPPPPPPQPQPQHQDGGGAKNDGGHVDRGHHD